ncbi:Lrp/AsnC family transcriptional regulator [Ramlibacter henchirensis]|uniref:Lrp/AsnC family transcriptional regulator n=1 Tax=Ramlibacter henchirensis TaxID=204072 RepID=A0A4Z0CB32_9BURK|nr:Lrp/AsnC family transcriptional regulator [Ramlibacter henchirensis]TFZ07279.1 Lrp/AsnC family transcriptional regulator [Ramlibacter henchirensis]
MEEEALDALDIALLSHLQEDASLTNQDLAARVHISPPTCLRRVKRLVEAGFIERQVAILSRDRLARLSGAGLEAVVEITLDRQDNESMEAFEAKVVADAAVQQCYRVSPGPDFILVVQAPDMPGYLALAQRLFTADANVRNVKAFFAVKRAKFGSRIALPKPARGAATSAPSSAAASR